MLTDRQRKAMFAKRSGRPQGLVTKQRGAALLAAHEGLVKTVARRFARQYPTAQLEDLLQEGRMGLLRAGKLYKKQPGAKFSTYASHHIAKRVREAAQASHLVHVPEKKLRRGQQAITIGGEGGWKRLARRGTDGGIGRAHATVSLARLFKQHLTPTERQVMTLRHLNGQLTHREAAKRLKKSPATIHALEKKAFVRLRRASLRRER